MRTPHSSSSNRPRFGLAWRVVAAALLALTVPLPAHAQIGSLAKRMARKAANEASAKAEAMSGVNSPAPTFDEQLLELSESRADAMLAGLTAARATTAPGGARALSWSPAAGASTSNAMRSSRCTTPTSSACRRRNGA